MWVPETTGVFVLCIIVEHLDLRYAKCVMSEQC